MKTILLEGTELSGKTTLVRELEKLSGLEGLTIKTNVGCVNKNCLFLNKTYGLAEKVHPGNIREILYTAGLIFDKNPEEVYRGMLDLFVQERSFPSIISYSKVFHRFGFSKYLGELFLPLYPKFDYNFLITCSSSEREKRFEQRTNITSLDKMIKEKIGLAEMLESEMRRILESQENYEEIKTDDISSTEIAKYIIGLPEAKT